MDTSFSDPELAELGEEDRGNLNPTSSGLPQPKYSTDYNVYRHMVIEKKTEIYRRSSLGRSLASAIEELKAMNKIGDTLGRTILDQFDRTVARRVSYVANHVVFHAETVDVYSMIGDDWRIRLKNVIVSDTEYEIGEYDTCVIFASKPVPISM